MTEKVNHIQLAGNRNSNLELLRLVCMLFIVLHHFMVHGVKVTYLDGGQPTDYGLIFNSFLIIAVNCFILISGYFGIKAKWKSFVHLYLLCIFYALSLGIFYSITNNDFNFKDIFLYFFPFSHSRLWFIPNYFYLFLLSPMLNKVIDNCNKKEHLMLLVVWSILTFYFGFLWRQDINVNGYNFMNFIFLYLIGRFIALYAKNVSTAKRKTVYISIYLFCVVAIAACAVFAFHMGHHMVLNLIFAYNNPFVIIASIAFFLFFRSLNFQNKAINWCASSALAIYLIHENRVVRSFLYPYVENFYLKTNNHYLFTGYLLLLSFVVIICCVLIDKIRMILTAPIERLLNCINWDAHVSKLVNKVATIIK